MERRSDRALPTIATGIPRWLRTLPLFAVIMTGSILAIFNYQKQSSSVVGSTLYALRTNPAAREILGDEIYFASQIPWIRGEINQLHGRIDISFWVKGTKTQALMRFRSERPTRMGYVSAALAGLCWRDENAAQLTDGFSSRRMNGRSSLREDRLCRCCKVTILSGRKLRTRSLSRRRALYGRFANGHPPQTTVTEFACMST